MTLAAALVPIAAAYLQWPSYAWNFDGVACAAAIEHGDWTYLFHSQHLLYGVLGWVAYQGAASVIEGLRALPVLQIVTSLFSLGGLAGMWKMAAALTRDRWLAAALTVFFAFSSVFWIWSLEPQVYPLGFLGLAWATATLVTGRGSSRYRGVGFWHGVAVLGHVMNLLWALPAIYYARREAVEEGDSGRLKNYVCALSATVLIPYALVLAAMAAFSPKSWSWIWIWLKGSAGLTPDRGFAWHWEGWQGPWIWIKSTPSLLWGIFQPYGNVPTAPWLWAATAVAALAFFYFFAAAAAQRRSRVWAFSWIWLAVYGVFLWTWEPGTLCYRMTDVVPLALIAALGAHTWAGKRWGRACAASAAAAMFLVNLETQIRPMNRPELNPTYQDALALGRETPPDALYVTADSKTWLYLLYFTGRQAHYIGRLPDNFWAAARTSGRPLIVDQGVPLPDQTSAKSQPVPGTDSWIRLR